MDFVVSHIEQQYPDARLYFVGFSLGSSYGARFLAGNQQRIRGMVCVANPFDVYKAGVSLNSYRNSVYS